MRPETQYCESCEDEGEDLELCSSCGFCSVCCECDELYDADELGLDPEDDDLRRYHVQEEE